LNYKYRSGSGKTWQHPEGQRNEEDEDEKNRCGSCAISIIKTDERMPVILRMMPASAWHLMIQTQGILSPVHFYI
jgi:hypothetical protein